MTPDEDDDKTSRENAARSRLSEITDLFAEMRAITGKFLREAGSADSANTKQIMSKISELQSVHLMVIRAEEAFHEKFGQGDIADGIDYDAARDDIGRALDRLRTAVDAKFVSGRADRDPD